MKTRKISKKTLIRKIGSLSSIKNGMREDPGEELERLFLQFIHDDDIYRAYVRMLERIF